MDSDTKTILIIIGVIALAVIAFLFVYFNGNQDVYGTIPFMKPGEAQITGPQIIQK